MDSESQRTADRVRAIMGARALHRTGKIREAIKAVDAVLDGPVPPMASAPLVELRDLWRGELAGCRGR